MWETRKRETSRLRGCLVNLQEYFVNALDKVVNNTLRCHLSTNFFDRVSVMAKSRENEELKGSRSVLLRGSCFLSRRNVMPAAWQVPLAQLGQSVFGALLAIRWAKSLKTSRTCWSQ